ncbi:OLC1v1008087C1 [Oldenlandia corymbosa var. corymbosa]|uniref:OLC1v1008087C1 n=1 Tax=Oldenlandia corymbosa var. corymbosa TaxID=529605 RepID=A0AAV1DL63_OLDCO|nr:OLC1v1008087C1 [Oldenlandia corymbosa var. corymbosa]
MPDDSFVIDHKLLYNDLVGLICERVGWNRKNVNLSLSILYDTMRNGFRRIAKIKDDASLQVLYFLPSSTYIDLYVDLEVEGTSRSHLEVGTSSGRPNVENVDYMEDDDVGGPFMEDGDHMEYDHGEDDEDYTSISDQSDENQSISEGSRRVMKRSKTNSPQRIGTYIVHVEEAKNGIAAWNIEQKREFYVKESDGSTWSIWCKSLKESTPKGYVPCRWKVRASLRDHGLWEIVKWVPEHNCMNVTEDNNNRNVSATLIAHLIRHKVELDPDYEVKLVQEEVKDRMHVDVPYHRAWEGRRKAIDLVYGDWVSNFDILPRNELRDFSNDAYLYLEEIDACQWTLAKDKHYRWGNQTTNISESYNNVLKGVRFLPIRALVEATFIKTVDLFQEEYVKSRKCITPVPTDLWEDFKKKEKKAAQHKVNRYGAINGKFKVKSRARLGGKGDNTYTVKYEEKKCSCKKWQEYRFPCTHALAVCRKIKDQPINTVNPYFRVVAWQDQFSGRDDFSPVADMRRWPKLWVWERIPRLQPKRKVKDESYLVPDAPLGNRWKCPKSKANIAAHCVAGIRDQLSSLRDGDVRRGSFVGPSRTIRAQSGPSSISMRPNCAEYPLINDIDRWNAIHHGCLGTGKAYDDWVQKHTEVRPHWNVRDQHVVPHELGDPELGPQCTSDYMPWFQKKTIRFMTDPTQYGPLAQGYHSSSSLERFYSSNLSDIYHLADAALRENPSLGGSLEDKLFQIFDKSFSALTLGPRDMSTQSDTQVLQKRPPESSQNVVLTQKTTSKPTGGGRRKRPGISDQTIIVHPNPTPMQEDDENDEGNESDENYYIRGEEEEEEEEEEESSPPRVSSQKKKKTVEVRKSDRTIKTVYYCDVCEEVLDMTGTQLKGHVNSHTHPVEADFPIEFLEQHPLHFEDAPVELLQVENAPVELALHPLLVEDEADPIEEQPQLDVIMDFLRPVIVWYAVFGFGTRRLDESDDEEVAEGDKHVHSVKGMGGKLIFPERIRQAFYQQWEHMVVVKLMGKKITRAQLNDKIREMWRPKQGFVTMDMTNDFFGVILSNQEDEEKALLGGPWHIGGLCMFVQKWYQGFRASTAPLTKVATWVRLPDLSITYYHEIALNAIGDFLGRIIKIDPNTLNAKRGNYARIAVELDVDTPLTARFQIDEGWYNICYNCGKIGHGLLICPEKEAARERQTVSTESQPKDPPGSGRDHPPISTNAGSQGSASNPTSANGPVGPGPWLVVQRRPRRGAWQLEQRNWNTQTGVPGSRFGVLATEPDSDVDRPQTTTTTKTNGQQSATVTSQWRPKIQFKAQATDINNKAQPKDQPKKQPAKVIVTERRAIARIRIQK